MTDLRQKYRSFDTEIYWIVDSMYSDACEDLFRQWQKAEPRPTVGEVKELLWSHSSGLADAWSEYMADWEDEDSPSDAPQFTRAVEWIVREYISGDVLFEEIDRERRRHRNENTSDEMVESILRPFGLAQGWAEWLARNR